MVPVSAPPPHPPLEPVGAEGRVLMDLCEEQSERSEKGGGGGGGR